MLFVSLVFKDLMPEEVHVKIVLQAVSSFNGQLSRQNKFKGFSLTALHKPIGIYLCSRLGGVSDAGWYACEFE